MYTIECKVTLPEKYDADDVEGLRLRIDKAVVSLVDEFYSINEVTEVEGGDAISYDTWMEYYDE